MQEYGTARAIGQFVGVVGWVVVALGIVLLVVALGAMGSFGLLALAPSVGLVLGGLLLICQGQLTEALIDTALNTRKIATLLSSSQRTGLNLDRPQALADATPADHEAARVNVRSSSNAESIDAPRSQLDADAEVNIYLGERITKVTRGSVTTYKAYNMAFTTLKEAVEHVDRVKEMRRRNM